MRASALTSDQRLSMFEETMVKRKFEVDDPVIGNDRKASFRGRIGTVLAYEKPGQYWVQFRDGVKECVDSRWLDRLPR